jgi:hypothetical protein
MSDAALHVLEAYERPTVPIEQAGSARLATLIVQSEIRIRPQRLIAGDANLQVALFWR